MADPIGARSPSPPDEDPPDRRRLQDALLERDGIDPVRGTVDVVVIGASAGGVTALADLIQVLPVDTAAALLVVLHVPTSGTSVLADILRRRALLPVVPAAEDMPLRRGCVVVAQPGYHLLLADAHVGLSASARVNGHRPAIDPLFESASQTFGPRVLGILLSGMLDDGVAGLGAIRRCGGVTAVQDPAEAPYPGMPKSAIEAGVVDRTLCLADLSALIVTAAAGRTGAFTPYEPPPEPPSSTVHDPDPPPSPVPDPDPPSSPVQDPAPLPSTELMFPTHHDETRPPSPFTCPNCGGSLWATDTTGIEQYECRVGHRYSPTSLFQVQGEALDDVLWAAHRALLERADLARRMARRMRRSNLAGRAGRYVQEAEEAVRRAASLHEALVSASQLVGPADDEIESEDIAR